MISLFVIYFSLIFSISQCIDVDVSSIHVNPDLYRLCWKQSHSKKPDSKSGQFPGPKLGDFTVFEDRRESGMFYCIEKRDNQIHNISFPLFQKHGLHLSVYFSIPFASAMPIIRKRIVSNGVHLQLHRDFVGIYDGLRISCNGILEYQSVKQIEFKTFDMNSNDKFKIFLNLDPGTSFNIYYSCLVPRSMKTSTGIMTDQGTIYPRETVHPLQPFLQLPFRRFLVGHWKAPQYVPKSYKVVIYEIHVGTGEKCLKIFHFNSLSSDNNIPAPKICVNTVPVEDMGIFQPCANCSIYFVLDMVIPLAINNRHKLSVMWMSENNKLEENFIYFEPLPNENIGYINPAILNFHQGNYDQTRNMISDIYQSVIPQYPINITVNGGIKFQNSSQFSILPSIGRNQADINDKPKIITHGYINEKCTKEIPSCANGPSPFYYLLIKTKLKDNYQVELIQIPKNEILNKMTINITADSKTYTFGISWSINSVPKTNIPSLYAVLMKLTSTESCSSLYIVPCGTCNKMHQQISEYNSKEILNEWNKQCKNRIRLDDQYGSMDSSVTINTREMIPEENFIAEIYAINLNSSTNLGRSKPEYIKESFWEKYGRILTGVICSIIGIGLLVLLALGCKSLAKDPIKDIEEVECNKYYTEDG